MALPKGSLNRKRCAYICLFCSFDPFYETSSPSSPDFFISTSFVWCLAAGENIEVAAGDRSHGFSSFCLLVATHLCSLWGSGLLPLTIPDHLLGQRSSAAWKKTHNWLHWSSAYLIFVADAADNVRGEKISGVNEFQIKWGKNYILIWKSPSCTFWWEMCKFHVEKTFKNVVCGEKITNMRSSEESNDWTFLCAFRIYWYMDVLCSLTL